MKLGKLSVKEHGRGREVSWRGDFPIILYIFRRGTTGGVEHIFDLSKFAHWHLRCVWWKAG